MANEIGKSRNEALLENILGADNEILPPESRIEVLLKEILDNGTIPENVADWLDEHPEATTTVEDGSITAAKFASGVIDDTLSVAGAAAEAKATGDAVADLKSAINYNYAGLESFLTHGRFAIGGLDTDGTLKPTQTTRVSSYSPANKMTFDRDITVNVKSGYTWGYIPFTGDTPGSWVGWLSTATVIPANTSFVVQIRKNPEGTATADISSYVSALTFDMESTEDIDDLKDATDSFYKNGYIGLQFTLEDGGINSGSGANYSGDAAYKASHKRCNTYITLEEGYEYLFIAPEGMYVNVYRYSSANSYIGNLGFSQTLTYTNANSEKIRIAFSSIDGTTAISINDIEKYGIFTVNNIILKKLFDIVSAPCYEIPSGLSTSKVFSEVSTDSRACQGSCTDGAYLYVAYIKDSSATELLKIDMSTWTVSARVEGNWGHMNDLYYNATDAEIWSIYNTSDAYNTMIKFKASDLSVAGTLDLSSVAHSINESANFTGITYLSDYDRYVFAVAVGSTLIGFAYLKPDFSLEKFTKINQSSRTTQNIDLYNNMLVETDYNPGNRINYYDFNGNKIGYTSVSDGTELESFSSANGKIYLVYNTSSYLELAIYECSITALAKIAKAEVLSQYNPN